MSTVEPEIRVLFVCLGNICRSPTAEGIMRQRLEAGDLIGRVAVDSAGTGPWHVGDPPDQRAMAAAAERGYDLRSLRGRQVSAADLESFDYVIAMDENNLGDLQAMAAGRRDVLEKIALLGDFSAEYRGRAVGDPYYGGTDGFDRVLDMIERCIDDLVATIQARLARA